MNVPIYRRVVLLVVVCIAVVLRIANLTGESLWRDEVDSVRFAFEPLGDILRNFTANGFNGPLYHLLLRGWLSLAGEMISRCATSRLSAACCSSCWSTR